jgi:hypothetical protein
MSDYLLWLPDVIAAAGVPVVAYDGWEYRARSSGGFVDGKPWAVFWHHTASTTDPDNDAAYMCYSADARPIANLLMPRDGTCWVLAAGATNTNGTGGPWETSSGRIDADCANSSVVGMEIANGGTGDPYPARQVDACFAVSLAITAHLGIEPGDIATHTRWSPGRKIDPATAAAVEGGWRPGAENASGSWRLEDIVDELYRRHFATGDETVTDDDIERIARRAAELVWTYEIDSTTGDGTGDREPARFLLDRTYNTVQRLAGD